MLSKKFLTFIGLVSLILVAVSASLSFLTVKFIYFSAFPFVLIAVTSFLFAKLSKNRLSTRTKIYQHYTNSIIDLHSYSKDSNMIESFANFEWQTFRAIFSKMIMSSEKFLSAKDVRGLLDFLNSNMKKSSNKIYVLDTDSDEPFQIVLVDLDNEKVSASNASLDLLNYLEQSVGLKGFLLRNVRLDNDGIREFSIPANNSNILSGKEVIEIELVLNDAEQSLYKNNLSEKTGDWKGKFAAQENTWVFTHENKKDERKDKKLIQGLTNIATAALTNVGSYALVEKIYVYDLFNVVPEKFEVFFYNLTDLKSDKELLVKVAQDAKSLLQMKYVRTDWDVYDSIEISNSLMFMRN